MLPIRLPETARAVSQILADRLVIIGGDLAPVRLTDPQRVATAPDHDANRVIYLLLDPDGRHLGRPDGTAPSWRPARPLKVRAEPVDNAPARSGCVPDVLRAGSVAFHPDGIGGRSWACPGRFPASCPLEMTRPLQGFYVLSSETIREIPYFGLDRVGLTVSIRLLFPSID